MHWQDEALVISVRPHAETAAIAELFTRAHGRHLGLVHGGRSRKLRPVLQLGNLVDASWQARLGEHLGVFSLELKQATAARVIDRGLPLLGLESLAALMRLLPERDPYASLFEVTLFVLEYLDDDAVWPALLARWELALLESLGFGLDFSECAATGVTEDLIYVSPRSGRSVSALAGEPYKDKLLRLPAFMRGGGALGLQPSDVLAGFALTGHFLERHVCVPRQAPMPEVRSRLLARLTASLPP
jgi:DNA repair protein RecO (recombination protein O)